MRRWLGWLVLTCILLSAGSAAAQTLSFQTTMDVAFVEDREDAEDASEHIAAIEVAPNETVTGYVVLRYQVEGDGCLGSSFGPTVQDTEVRVEIVRSPNWTDVTLAETRARMGGGCGTDHHTIAITLTAGPAANATSGAVTVRAIADEGACNVGDCEIPAAEDEGTITVSRNTRAVDRDDEDLGSVSFEGGDWDDFPFFPWSSRNDESGSTDTQGQSSGVVGMLPFLVPIGFFALVGFLGYVFMTRADKDDTGVAASQTAAAAATATGLASASVPRAGEVFLRKYRVERELGRGAFGSTWLAVHTGLERKAVIKQLHPEWAAVAEARERFKREAKILASLDHPYVTRVYDVEEVNGAWYLVMEYVDGGSLEDRLKDGPMTPYEAGTVIAQVLEGLACIHDEGILHRDLKPANVLLTGSGIVKIADFGVARSNAAHTALTMSGVSPGTPLYMAPEQIRGDGGDHRADLYAAAVLYYRCVTGKFYLTTSTEDYFALMRAVVEDPPALPVEGLSPALNDWLGKALAKDPAARFADAREMVQALIAAQNAD